MFLLGIRVLENTSTWRSSIWVFQSLRHAFSSRVPTWISAAARVPQVLPRQLRVAWSTYTQIHVCRHYTVSWSFLRASMWPQEESFSLICFYRRLTVSQKYVLAQAWSLEAFFTQYVLVNQDKQVQKQILQQFLRHKNYKLPCLLRDEFLGTSQLVATALLSLLVCSKLIYWPLSEMEPVKS